MGFKAMAMRGTFAKKFTARARRAVLRARRREGPQVIFPIAATTITLERKFFDVTIDDATIATGGTIAIDSVNKIPQGVTEITRVGRKCTIRQIGWRFTISIGIQSINSGADEVRVILYLDKQANGATAAVTDLLETSDHQSFNNLSNKHRFRTLMDRVYDYVPQASSGDGTTSDTTGFNIHDTFFKKVNIPLEFNSTSGAITEITSNNIGVLLLSRTGIMTFTSNMRLRFTDL